MVLKCRRAKKACNAYGGGGVGDRSITELVHLYWIGKRTHLPIFVKIDEELLINGTPKLITE